MMSEKIISLGVADSYENFDDLFDKVLEAKINDMERPIYGKLIKVTRDFITLQRISGAVTKINRKSIQFVTTTKSQEPREAGDHYDR